MATPAWQAAILEDNAPALFGVVVEAHAINIDAARSARLSQIGNMRESEYTSYEEYVLSFQAAVRQVAADWQVQAVNGTLPFDAVKKWISSQRTLG